MSKVKLYVVWPFVSSDIYGEPQLFCAEFEEKAKTYRCKREDYLHDNLDKTWSAFGYTVVISKEDIEKVRKLNYGGYPALTPQEAVDRWRVHLNEQLKALQRRSIEIKEALQEFKMPEELKDND